MTKQEIINFQKRAKYVAAKRGYPELADDFSQEIFIAFARGWHSTVEQLFSSYLRDQHGDTRTQCGLERRLAKNRTVSLDAPVSEDEGSASFHDIIGTSHEQPGDIKEHRGTAFLFTGREAEIYDLKYVEEFYQTEIGLRLGLSQGRIAQLIKTIKQEIQNQYVLTQLWERYQDERNLSQLEIEWITL